MSSFIFYFQLYYVDQYLKYNLTPDCIFFLSPFLWMQGGRCDLCNMGTCYSSIPGFFSSFSIF